MSPVYYASAGHAELYWVSRPEARHSRNIEARPRVGIVVFDSRAQIGRGQPVYMSADAELVSRPEDVERGIEVFSRRSTEHGGRPWTPEDVGPTSEIRLYRARVAEHFVLGARDERERVEL